MGPIVYLLSRSSEMHMALRRRRALRSRRRRGALPRRVPGTRRRGARAGLLPREGARRRRKRYGSC